MSRLVSRLHPDEEIVIGRHLVVVPARRGDCVASAVVTTTRRAFSRRLYKGQRIDVGRIGIRIVGRLSQHGARRNQLVAHITAPEDVVIRRRLIAERA